MPLPTVCMEVVDLDLEDDAPSCTEPPVSSAKLREAMSAIIAGSDPSSLSLKVLRSQVEARLSVKPGGLDNRRSEIKALASELVQAQSAALQAQPPPQPSATPVACSISAGLDCNPAKKRKSLLSGGETPVVAVATGAGDVNGKPVQKRKTQVEKVEKAKRKAAPSAYSLYMTDCRGSVQTELSATLGKKPSLGEVTKTVAARWRDLPAAERLVFEQRAKDAAAELKANPPSASAVEPRGRGQRGGRAAGSSGKGKGKTTDGAAAAAMTRAEFLTNGQALRMVLDQVDSSQEGPAAAATISLLPRMYKTGSVGWFSSCKIQIPVGGEMLTVQCQISMTVANSKTWQDGAGLADIAQRVPADVAPGQEVAGPAAVDVPAVVVAPVVVAPAEEVPLEAVSLEDAPPEPPLSSSVEPSAAEDEPAAEQAPLPDDLCVSVDDAADA